MISDGSRAPPVKGLKKRYTFGFWNRYLVSNIHTRLALPWSRLFVRMGMTPNQVTFISLAASVAGIALIALVPGWWTGAVLGTSLLMLGIVWDHSDGQVARMTGQGSPTGALLDTVLDRWIELGWVVALGFAAVQGTGRLHWDWPAWSILLATVLAAHATLYVRWSNIQKDLYLLQAEIKRSQVEGHPGRLEVEPQTVHAGKLSPVTTFYLPFAFNRDVTFWLLAAATLSADWVLGLVIFGALHSLRGLEKNWYTRGDLKRDESRMVAALMDPDYHK